MTKASLVENDNKNVDLLLLPLKGGDVVNETTVSQLIEQSGYATLMSVPTNIKNALAELTTALKPLQHGQAGNEIRYEILQRIDASISISIGSDEMSAEAEITAARGGHHLTAKAILDAAREAGVKKGFNKELLIKVAHKAAKADPGAIVKRQIAIGKEAINGKDAKIKPLVQSAQERILRPKEREDGSVDMRDLGDIVCVRVGEPLAQKLPLTEGEKGYTVTASPLLPEPGQDTDLIAGEGTAISDRNENILVSKLVGLPKIIDNGMTVDEVYQAKKVDISTGHIDFKGSVVVDGDVAEGMKVYATGDITISGFVESAEIDAGGDITISGGIIGRKQDIENNDISDFQMSASIRAKGKIYAKYCQYVELVSKDDIRIENQLMHSQITTGGKLWVGTEDKANGKLIGGCINAYSSVHAGVIGATAGSKTQVVFNEKINEFNAHIANLEQQLQVETEKTNEIQAALEKIKRLPKEKQNKSVLSKVVTTFQFHSNKMGEILNEKNAVDESILAYMNSVYVEATETLHQHVELVIGDYVDRSKREYPPSRMRYNERKIIIDPIV